MDDDILAKLKDGDYSMLKQLYREYRPDFIQEAFRKFSLDENDAAEIFQDSIMILYENISSGRLKQLVVPLKNYLFGIGRNKMLETKRRKGKIVSLIESNSSPLMEDGNKVEDLMNMKLHTLKHVMIQIGDSCRKLLELFYFHRYNMEVIAEKLGHKNADTTKNLKYKCLQRLRTKFYDEYQNDRAYEEL